MNKTYKVSKKAKSNLIETLDDLVSKFVRLSYADEFGIVKCFTCNRSMNWKQIENGHYHSRRHNSIRFDTKNCFPQCHTCNCEKDGNHEVFKDQLIKHFGTEIIEYLDSKKIEFKSWADWELREEIKEYRKLLREFDIV